MNDDRQATYRRERLQARIIVGATIVGVAFVAVLTIILLVKAVW
jgi:hypothetical protein